MIDLRISKKLFNSTYYPYLTDYSKKLEVYYGGAGSGKSFFIAQKLILKGLNDTRKILVIRKNQVSQKESCWALVKEILSQWQILGYCQIRISDYVIELPNGTVILFKGLDDPEKIKSIVGITDIWIEEATELSKEDYDQLQLRLRANTSNLQMFLSFNPISKTNWVFKEFFQHEISKDVQIIKTTYKDNNHLPQAYIDKLEQMIDTNPTYYRIYVLGEFCSLDKLVYNNWEISDEDPPVDGELCIGLDFGFTNDLTALVASIIKGNSIYIFKTYGSTGKTNIEIAEIIKNLGFSKSTIIADSAEPKSIEELKRAGIQRIKASKKGPDSIIHGIQQLQGYKIKVKPDCEGIITEFQNYSWIKDKQTGEYTNKPSDDFNHYLDALRYSLQCMANKIKILDKSKLGVL